MTDLEQVAADIDALSRAALTPAPPRYQATRWAGVLDNSRSWPNVIARCESVQTAGRIAALLNGSEGAAS
jgi:hypothetical protein